MDDVGKSISTRVLSDTFSEKMQNYRYSPKECSSLNFDRILNFELAEKMENRGELGV